MQLPVPVNERVTPSAASWQAPELELGSIENTTGLEDPPPVAERTVEVPYGAVEGGMKLIACSPWPTTNEATTCCAASKLASLAWFTSITHSPAAAKLTVPPSRPETLHTPAP